MAHTSTVTNFIQRSPVQPRVVGGVGSRVRSLVQAMPNGVVLLDVRGYVREANKEAIRLLGEALEGERWRDVINRAFRPQADDGHEVSLRSGRRVRLDISSLKPEPGQLIVLTDLSETRALLERISHLQRLTAMGRMVASLAHQIRTPLSAALLYAENLGRDDLSLSQQQKFSHKVTDRLKDLEQQVNDMLLYAKSGEQQPVTRISIARLLKSLVAQIQPLAEREGVRLSIVNNAGDTELIGNLSSLTGALQNLIVNAIQASDPGAEVVLSIETQQELLRFVIQDQGVGMKASDLEHIFTPFFTRKTHGTGLGLAVVKTIVIAHQGQISVKSIEGKGTTFTLDFPLTGIEREKCNEETSHESS